MNELIQQVPISGELLPHGNSRCYQGLFGTLSRFRKQSIFGNLAMSQVVCVFLDCIGCLLLLLLLFVILLSIVIVISVIVVAITKQINICYCYCY